MNCVNSRSWRRMMSPVAAALAITFAAAQGVHAAKPTPPAELHGAGSTFVQPVLKEWAYEWTKKSGVNVNYEGGGSGAGISKAKAGQVDFGATDAPLGEEDLAASGLVQFPIVTGGIVIVEHLSDLGRRRLQINPSTLSAIFMGKITKWNDPALVALNPGATLPDAPIAVVHRSEGSGTTYNFSAYLTKVSPEWAGKLGTAKTINWPVGTGTEGNQNVAEMVANTPNSIGYVEYGYALAHNMRIATLHNSDGSTVYPTQTTIRNAVDAADWEHAAKFNLLLVGVQGKDVWPIAATTWIVMPANGPNTTTSLEFFRWALHGGGQIADAQGYTPIPAKLTQLIEASWTKSFAASKAAAAAR